MNDPEYRSGDVNIQWLEERLAGLTSSAPPRAEVEIAAVGAALLAHRDRGLGRARPGESNAPDRNGERDDGDSWRRAARQDALR
jgi:hypothetical protein